MLSGVRPIISQDCVYFVKREIDTQTDHIMKLLLNCNKENVRVAGLETVYSTSESEIVALQTCSDTE